MHPRLIPKRNEFSGIWEFEFCQEMPYLRLDGTLGIIPPFYSFDGLSGPALVHIVFHAAYDPAIVGPSAIHDLEYLLHLIPRESADENLKANMVASGESEAGASTAYKAVRLFGEPHWMNSAADLQYIEWLKAKLIKEGYDPGKYHLN